jgi:DNA-binding MarR family transcriptional regulator
VKTVADYKTACKRKIIPGFKKNVGMMFGRIPDTEARFDESLNRGLTSQPPMNWITDEHMLPRAMKQFMDKKMTVYLGHLGIQGSQGLYLMAIARNPGASLKDIATYMMVDKSITSRIVGALMETGFVVNGSDDPRRYSLSLTEKGEHAVKFIRKTLAEIWEELLSDLTDEELNAFKSACSKINSKLNQEFSEPKGTRN